MIYNYIRCESVIAKIMADLDISEKHLRITDIKEWIFEAVDKIGAPMLYKQCESGVDSPILKIEDKQVPLPHGIQHLDAIAYSHTPDGPWIPMRKDTSSFHDLHHNGHFKHGNKYTQHCTDESEHEYLLKDIMMANPRLYVRTGGKYIDTMFPHHYHHYDDLTYFIKPGWIVTNRKHGFIKLAYKTIQTDEKGLPLIPELSSYQEAVYWYVVMKLSFPKYLKGQLGGKGVNSAQNTYFYILQQWNFYRNQAYAECMMPTAGDMETIKNDWTKLVPDWDSNDTFFNHQGDRQIITNDYYYGY